MHLTSEKHPIPRHCIPLSAQICYFVLSVSHGRTSADYDDARQKYADAMHTLGYQADLAYNTALCYFKDKQYVAALKHVGELRLQPLSSVYHLAFEIVKWFRKLAEHSSLSGVTSGASQGPVKRDDHIISGLEILPPYLALSFLA